MRIGIVVDSACDLPRDFLDRNDVRIMPIAVRVGDRHIEDRRRPDETLAFYRAHLDNRREDFAESVPYTPVQIEALFLERLVLDFDYVFCLTITQTRSAIFDNAMHAARAILTKYKAVRRAAGMAERFGLTVFSTRNLFTGQAVPVAEAVRLIRQGGLPSEIGVRLKCLIDHTHAYLVPADLFHIHKRASKKGDTSVGWMSYRIGSLLDVKPILHCHRDVTKTADKVRGFEVGVERLFTEAVDRIREGLETPHICISYGGDPTDVLRLPGYDRLAKAATDNAVEVLIAPMSTTAAVNVGPGALSLAFASRKHTARTGNIQ